MALLGCRPPAQYKRLPLRTQQGVKATSKRHGKETAAHLMAAITATAAMMSDRVYFVARFRQSASNEDS